MHKPDLVQLLVVSLTQYIAKIAMKIRVCVCAYLGCVTLRAFNFVKNTKFLFIFENLFIEYPFMNVPYPRM